ncbi:MAG: phosphoethanolamine--lipid A transferase [Desulfobulbaceae bacterium]
MKISQAKLILLLALFFVAFDNTAFFSHVLEVYPLTWKNAGFLFSLAVGLTAVIVLLLTLITSRKTIKPVATILLVLSSLAAYFMNNYNVVIDHEMIRNILQTNLHEATDLLSLKLLGYLLVLGILPSVLVWRVTIPRSPWKRALLARLAGVVGAVLLILVLVLSFSRFYTSFFREHKPLRYYTNPTYSIYSAWKYCKKTYFKKDVAARPLGLDAHIPEDDRDRELIIIVVGEAARADRFSLNGYQRETNPLLQRENVVSFSRMYSCGTSTAYSVPCMFSSYTREDFTSGRGESTENLLDVLRHAGIHVLWRENNSDSKGVADRVEFQDYRQPALNTVCDVECRDVGMLVGLQEYIDSKQQGDIVIVLHQMGNHGPAYYKRYPKEFERFTPVCETNQFDECSNEEINNAYDNAILYTDFFLSRVIRLLKKNSDRFETAMLYMSDHGESLGEHNIYLHGLPYAMAPDEQKHIAAVFWFGPGIDVDGKRLAEKADLPLSHDNLFHTVLGLVEVVDTPVYDRRLDILAAGGPPQ